MISLLCDLNSYKELVLNISSVINNFATKRPSSESLFCHNVLKLFTQSAQCKVNITLARLSYLPAKIRYADG